MAPAQSSQYDGNLIMKHGWQFLLGIFIILLYLPAPSLAQQGGISVGQTVEVTSGQGLRLRAKPSDTAEVIATMPYKTQMKVIGGPRSDDKYTWWELEGEPGRGWAVGNYLKVVEGEVLSAADESYGVDGTGCTKPYPAIEYCPSRGTSTYVVRVNLADPHVRIETIMANDKMNVNTANREFVSSMGERRQAEGTVVVINADYFGDSTPIHGPEGLTIVDGQRLDGPDHGDFDNGVATLRSAYVFSRPRIDGGNSPIRASIVRLKSDNYVPDPEEMYCAIGGGPQIVFDGTWDWTRGRGVPKYKDYPQCPGDYASNDVINGECFRNTADWDDATKMWTVVGIASDGRLTMLLTPYEHVEMVLKANNIQEAVKLDGGGSSQMWFNGEPVVKGGRDIANALAVFYKYDYEIVEPPAQVPVVVSGEQLEIKMTLKNIGADTWTQNNYAVSIIKSPWEMSIRSELPHDVKPGETVILAWLSPVVEKEWGFYSFDLQLVDQGKEFPMRPISIRAIVIPRDLADKKEELEQKIKDMLEQGMEDIEQAITEWVKRQLMGYWERLIYDLTHCNVPFAVLVMAAVLFRRRSR